jgi:hypothetical protein
VTGGANAPGTSPNYLGMAGGALNVYNGIRTGGVAGYGGAALGANKVLNSAGGYGSSNPYLGAAGNVLGIYSGVKQGGVAGYGGAAVNAAELAGVGGSAIPYVGAALGAYNVIANSQSGRTGSDALQGAESGAAVGTMFLPGIGTAIGAVAGGALGAIASAFGPGAKDPEMQNWGNYKDAFNADAAKGGVPGAMKDVSQVQNPYKILAGLFDLRQPQFGSDKVPIYEQYGRMGEQKFTNDMMKQIDSAKSKGITDPNQMYSSVVKPWIDSFGKGQNTGKNGAAIEGLLQQMTAQYMNGSYQSNWKDVDNGTPFAPKTPTATGTQGGGMFGVTKG